MCAVRQGCSAARNLRLSRETKSNDGKGEKGQKNRNESVDKFSQLKVTSGASAPARSISSLQLQASICCTRHTFFCHFNSVR